MQPPSSISSKVLPITMVLILLASRSTKWVCNSFVNHHRRRASLTTATFPRETFLNTRQFPFHQQSFYASSKSRLFSSAANSTTTTTTPTTLSTTTATSTSSSLYPAFPAHLYHLPPTPSIIPSTSLPRNQRIIAIGDVHGDLPALCSFLTTAKLLDPQSTISAPRWSGNDTILVQVGDVLDRGDDELVCFRLLTSLARQASQYGGMVKLLHGNHEAMNALGLFQYTQKGGNMEFEAEIGLKMDDSLQGKKWRLPYAGNEPARWIACEPGGLLADTLLANMELATVVGTTVFCHAGLTANHIRDSGGIEEMNEACRLWFKEGGYQQDPLEDMEFRTVEEVVQAAQKRASRASGGVPPCLGGGIGDPSPVWMRDYSSPHDAPPTNPKAQSMIDEMLEILGQDIGGDVKRLVMGHTPQNQINAALKGKAWRIDVGASKGVMSGVPEVLEIIHQGGEDGEDVINILRVTGEIISGVDRHVVEDLL